MHIFAHSLMLIAVFLLVAGAWTNLYNIIHKKPGIYPWFDGLLAAYVVAYFVFIY